MHQSFLCVSFIRITSFDPDISGYKVWYTSSLELRWFSASLTEIRSKHRKHGASFPPSHCHCTHTQPMKTLCNRHIHKKILIFENILWSCLFIFLFWKYVYYYITISHHIKWYNNDKESFHQKYTIY